VFLVLLRWRWPDIPGLLLAVLLATGAVAAFSLASHGVSVVGTIPAGFPVPQLPALHPGTLRSLALPAFTVLIVAFSDDVLTGRSFPRRGETIIANRELLALGIANAGAALVRGFPVSSSATRSAIAVTTRSRTQVYSLVTAVTVIAVLLVARPVLARFPDCSARRDCHLRGAQAWGPVTARRSLCASGTRLLRHVSRAVGPGSAGQYRPGSIYGAG
jgi:sulfate permease, SulP family